MNTPTLHIDIETYSSLNIKTCGAYKYFSSPDFEILLIGYAFDDGPVEIIDLASGDKMPLFFTKALQDPRVLKYAHNANFERRAFEAAGYHTEITAWRCSAIKAAYCGLPLKLEDVSKALQLGDKGKLATGRALMKYFCEPCRPTKANEGRTRNLPEHDPEKWQQFIEYCLRDVEAERAIEDRLQAYSIPEFEQAMYGLDQKINDRGIGVDLPMARRAIEIDNYFSDQILDTLKDLTGLENPNSPAQLKEWLSAAMKKEITSLAKDSVTQLIEESESEAVTRVLKLRVKAAKTSTKKYVAITNCALQSSRAHGLFQFYGANRTGRWAGRLIQLQNLPRNYIRDLKLAREAIKTLQPLDIALLYDNVPKILSELIRTTFVPSPGQLFAVSDFSAIEARVLAWLADETWRLEVFRSHGKIYEASAAMMFDVPIEQITKGSSMRDKGKVSELALGYQGALGALKKMGGEAMGLSDQEMSLIVNKWRTKSPNIVAFWNNMNDCAMQCVRTGKTVKSDFKGLLFERTTDAMTVQLPSGRKLFYWDPRIATNRWGHPSLKYKGMDQTTKKWWWVDTYGGKITENIVQAVSRDILAEAMARIDARGFDIVMHVHDEIVSEVNAKKAPELLEQMNAAMGEDLDWAPGLPLEADGYITEFYKKD